MRLPDAIPLCHERGTLLSWDPPVPRARAPALVLLHGAACGAWAWAEGFGGRLAAAGYDVLAPDFIRRRQGRPAGLADYAEDARAALSAIGRPAVLVGHSLGGLVAQRLLPDASVLGCALLAPAPPEGLAWVNWRLAMTDPPLWRAVARMHEPAIPPEERPLLRGALFSAGLPDAVAARHLHRMAGESRAALLEAQPPQPVVPAWSLGKPCFVLGARRDSLLPPDAMLRTAAWHLARWRLLDDIGHLMMLDANREALAEMLIAWLEESFP